MLGPTGRMTLELEHGPQIRPDSDNTGLGNFVLSLSE